MEVFLFKGSSQIKLKANSQFSIIACLSIFKGISFKVSKKKERKKELQLRRGTELTILHEFHKIKNKFFYYFSANFVDYKMIIGNLVPISLHILYHPGFLEPLLIFSGSRNPNLGISSNTTLFMKSPALSKI